MMTLIEAASAIGAEAKGNASFVAVDSDSRALHQGALFVALRGERFDGHAFVDRVAGLGAVAAMVARDWLEAQKDVPELPLLVVDDTRAALGRLASAWRQRFDLPVIGITGSNGKTTVKEMSAAIMSAWAQRTGQVGEAVLSTRGNLNNDIGLPLTLCGLRAHHQAAVIEMGMNRPGEIAYLSGLTRPTVALVNNAQRAHLQGVGTVQQVAEEKGAIYGGLSVDGVAVINADDPHAALWRQLGRDHAQVGFGFSAQADVRGEVCLHGLGVRLVIDAPQGRVTVDLQVPGRHNASNALAAAACALAAGAALEDVVSGLSGFTGVKGRLQRRPGPAGSVILDDSYNANPDSVRAGIDVLAATPGRKLLVLGDMGEIGDSSAQLHDEIGGYAKSKGVDGLFALGEMSAIAVRNFGEGSQHFRSPEALCAALKSHLDEDTVVLVKGSRFMRMERVVEHLVLVPTDPVAGSGEEHAA